MENYEFIHEVAIGLFSGLASIILLSFMLKNERNRKKSLEELQLDIEENVELNVANTTDEPSVGIAENTREENVEENVGGSELNMREENVEERVEVIHPPELHVPTPELCVITSPKQYPALSVEERLQLISRNAVDTIGLDEVEEKMKSGLSIRGYLGTAPTRSPSIGYFIPLMKFRDLVQADVDMTMFIADVHAFLDKGSRWIDRTQERTTYYIFIITEILKVLGVEPHEYTFVKGSNVQLDKTYIMDLFKLLTNVSDKQAKKAGSDVVKQNKDVMLSSLVYPLMQVIDAVVLSADIEIGGLDQRKIFALGRDYIERLGYDKCAHVMNELLPSLGKPGSKMSSSDLMGKIEFTDSKEQIAEKLKKAYCVEKDTKNNPCMDIARLIVFPIKGSLGDFTSYQELESLWVLGNVYAKQLKDLLIDAIDEIIDPIRKSIDANRNLYDDAFPAVEPLLVENKTSVDNKVETNAGAEVEVGAGASAGAGAGAEVEVDTGVGIGIGIGNNARANANTGADAGVEVDTRVGDKRKTYTIEQINEKIQQKARDTFLRDMQKLRYECDMGEL